MPFETGSLSPNSDPEATLLPLSGLFAETCYEEIVQIQIKCLLSETGRKLSYVPQVPTEPLFWRAGVWWHSCAVPRWQLAWGGGVLALPGRKEKGTDDSGVCLLGRELPGLP